MSTTISLPPSERDFQVYQRVVLEGASTRQTASDFSLSQTRVRQVVQRVHDWLTQTLPAPSEATDAARLHLARHLASDRLQYLYGQAMHGWRLTSESKYAGILIRVINAQAKLPVSAGTLEALAADALAGPLPEDAGTLTRSVSEGNVASSRDSSDRRQSAISNLQSAMPLPPPPGDCSPGQRYT